MKCLVINLDRSPDRLVHITSEFAKIGVPFERVPAIDASTVVRAPKLTNAETACFISHRRCWQIIADGADQFGAIFEDDVVFSNDAGSLLADTSWVPRDADIVKLETFLVKVRVSRSHISIGNRHSVVRLVGQHLGSAGYLISRNAAQRLLKQTKHPRIPIDNALFSPSRLTCSMYTNYQLIPALCVQSIFPTTVQMERPTTRKWDWLSDKIFGQFSRAYAHFRNGTFWGTRKMRAIPFYFETEHIEQADAFDYSMEEIEAIRRSLDRQREHFVKEPE